MFYTLAEISVEPIETTQKLFLADVLRKSTNDRADDRGDISKNLSNSSQMIIVLR